MNLNDNFGPQKQPHSLNQVIAQTKFIKTEINKLENATLDMLNEAFEADPGAIRSLLLSRVPCNKILADSNSCEVHKDENLYGEHYSLTTMDLINSVLAVNGLPQIDIKWQRDCYDDDSAFMVGFWSK